MTEIVMVAIGPEEIGGRTVFNTGLSTVGRAGNDYFCGHCGRRMMHNFDLDRMEAEVVYQCGGCEGLNVRPEPK